MAYSLNSVQLLGRLTAKPQEGIYPVDGTTRCSFTLAINNGKDANGNDRPADYIRIVAWGKLGEIAADNLEKGQRCYIQGRIKTGSFTVDGERKYYTQVTASQVIPLDKAQGINGAAAEDIPEGFLQIADDDIPF